MTSASKPPHAVDLSRVPRVVLGDDGLDRLELVLGGWLPPSALSTPPPDEQLVLTDAENTPLALISGATDDGLPAVRALAPMTRGSGPQWDPEVRLSAAGMRERLGDRSRAATALVIDTVPTHRLADVAIGLIHPEVIVVGSRRGPHRSGDVGWAGRTRAAWALADGIDAASPGTAVVRLVVPWPPKLGPQLADAGIGEVVYLSSYLPESDEAVASVSAMIGAQVAALYPPASAREVLRSLRGSEGPGAVVFFTGLSGSGKSTIARALADELADSGPRRVTLLDGDEVRQHLSRGLGFDAASREINVDRIAWVAALVAEHGGIAVAAPIAPFDAGRRNARAIAEARSTAFLLVWVSTPLDVCEARDRKGFYARARSGEIEDFTGISSPYEPPADADVVIDTTDVDVPEAVRRIRAALEGMLAANRDA